MNEIEKSAALVISENFELKQVEDFTFEKLHPELVQRIDFLLKTNPEKLFSILYCIDVSEAKAKQALVSSENAAREIADLIIERQLQKVKTRLEFGRDPGGDW